MYVHLYSTYTMRMFLQKVNIGAPAWLQNPTVVTDPQMQSWKYDTKGDMLVSHRIYLYFLFPCYYQKQ